MKARNINPDVVVSGEFFTIYPYGDTFLQELANIVLCALYFPKRRFRHIVFEDGVVEVLFATQEQAMRAVDDLAIGEDGNFYLSP